MSEKKLDGELEKMESKIDSSVDTMLHLMENFNGKLKGKTVIHDDINTVVKLAGEVRNSLKLKLDIRKFSGTKK